MTGRLEGNNTETEVKVGVPLKHLSNFWRTLDMSLINCEVSLILTQFENCVITSKAIRDANTEVVAVNNPRNVAFKITDTKFYVPVVTLCSTEDDNKLKTGFKRTVKWNKYRPEMSNHTKTENLNYLIDPTLLFIISFGNKDDRKYFSKYYTTRLEIKDFNGLIDGKSFF